MDLILRDGGRQITFGTREMRAPSWRVVLFSKYITTIANEEDKKRDPKPGTSKDETAFTVKHPSKRALSMSRDSSSVNNATVREI